jgi:hypothetical protein
VRVAGALLLLLLSGCLKGSCAYGPWTADWTDADLFGRFPAPGPHGRYEVEWRDPAPGLPFTNASLEARWGPFSVRTVVWDVPDAWSDARSTDLNLDTGGVVWAFLDAEATPEDLRRIFDAFAQNVSAADEANRTRWADEFIASEREEYRGYDGQGNDTFVAARYQVQIDGPYRLEALFARLAGPDGASAVVGRSLASEGWRWLFDVGQRTATREVEGAQVILSADALGTVRFAADHRDNPGDARLQGWLRDAYEDLALGDPPEASLRFHPSAIC